MEAEKYRISPTAFWCTAAVFAVALITLVGIQFVHWVKKTDEATATARAGIIVQFPTDAWALEMWERCRSNQGEFADSKTILLSDCDKAVLRAAAERGGSVEKSVVTALAIQADAARVAANGVSPDWPLAVIQSPHGRLASWVLSNRKETLHGQ
ncbi:hypothetical protein ACEN2T_18240 [Pseudomonas sp. W22_MBD1_FP4]|uniref:hypothetical protein n=1 Tax=Pseudomonas sp. W22_MBD1_FP4 TaxID=3240272 RepID=UPI003F98BF10